MKRFVISHLALCIALICGSYSAFAQNYAAIKINELLADNEDILLVDDSTPDYVELINTDSANINIGGMFISDAPSNPTKFRIPNETIIGGNQRLLIYFDDNTNSAGIHTGFTLGASGDTVRLYAPGNTLTPVDLLAYGIQIPNMSVGRVPDGTGGFVLTIPTPLQVNQAATLGSVTNLHINEWMALSITGTTTNADWVEFYNSSTNPVMLGGLVFTDDNTIPSNDDPIPALSFIAPLGFALLTQNTGTGNPDPDEFDFGLSSTSGERITLTTGTGAILHQITFGAQVANRSEGLLPDGNRARIFRFEVDRATPGESNFAPLTSVVVNEILAHTDPPLEDAIELYNTTGQAVDISHWWLSDSQNDPRKFRIPAGTIVQPFGYVVFYEYQFGTSNNPTGFNLSSANGDEVYIHTGDSSGNLTGFRRGVSFGPSENGVSIGRYVVSTNQTDFVPLSTRTFGMDNPTTLAEFRSGTGATNSGPRIGPVVINEIMFNPPGSAPGSTNENWMDEYIELHNISPFAVQLFHSAVPTNTWRLRSGADFDFPTNVTLPAGGFLLVVNFDPSTNAAVLDSFRTRFNVPPGTPIYGPMYSGDATNPQPARLSNGGEEIELKKPDFPQIAGEDIGLVPYINVDEVDYNDDPPWPLVENANGLGTGNSLQKLPSNSYGNYWANWRSMPPTPGSPNILDSDGDGMTDAFENGNQLNPNDPSDANLDPDNDRATNLQEFQAGTLPRNAQSVFRMFAGQRVSNTFTLSFTAVAGRTYNVQYRNSYNLDWVNWRTFTASTTGTISVTDQNANNSPTRFYRVVTAVP